MSKPINVFNIFSRYLIILLAGLGNLFIFYKLFTLPTVSLTVSILKLFSSEAIAVGSTIIFNDILIEIVPACIAGAAYYLLFILCMSIPIKSYYKQATIILFALGTFFLINVARIILFISIADTTYFETAHLITWYFLSTIIVILIWFLTVYVFKIKEIPVYTDVKNLVSQTKNTKRKTKHNKSSN